MNASLLGRLLRSNVGTHCAKRLVSTIKFAETGDAQLPKMPTFDYLSGTLAPFRTLLDSTDARLTDNTRMLVVEGNIGCGKSVVASRLADYFGMIYVPDATEDDIYVYRDVEPAFDLRWHNALLPKSAKYYTCEMFWTEPDLKNTGKPLYLQYQFFLRRLFNYLKGLCILMNTGRGIVTERSPFSELAFCDALYECGYISERGHRWFCQNHASACRSAWKPHLIVFIKTPIELIREHFKTRNLPWEMNGVNLSDKFLETYERILEKNYILPMSRYSEIVIVDRSTTDVYTEDDCRIIAQKITEIDLSGEHLLRDDYKLYQWRKLLPRHLSRVLARNNFSYAFTTFVDMVANIDPPTDIPELCYAHADREFQIMALQMDPRTTYAPKYNPYYSKLFDIMFNPYLAERNFKADIPKKYLWP